VAAGAGVALMATLGQTPEGLQARPELPRPAPLSISVWSRQGMSSDTSERIAGALRRVIHTSPYTVALDLFELPKGA
jgi:hypothetical protein